jgi:hypothetical protein
VVTGAGVLVVLLVAAVAVAVLVGVVMMLLGHIVDRLALFAPRSRQPLLRNHGPQSESRSAPGC